MKAKALSAALSARLVDASDPLPELPTVLYTKYLTRATLPQWITDLEQAQQPNGAFGGDYYNGGQKNFMTGMLLSALARYYDEVEPDPRILTMVERNIAYMWQNDWVPASQGFKYVSVDATQEAPSGQTLPSPGLNGLTVPAFAWLFARTLDATLRDQVDQQLAGLAAAERKWWEASGKAFDQAFARHFNVAAWRARGLP
jgi:hypothetical protein